MPQNPAETRDYNAMPEADFRGMVRAYVLRHFPAEFLHLARRVGPAEVADFNKKMSERGWIAPGWPVEWGGMGLDTAHQIYFAEELAAIGVPRLHEMGLQMLGPLLLKFGTEAQKNHYLPRIISTEDIWCQGYSEPGAGSDLAALRLAARPDGEDYILNGQKIWTTMAHQSNKIFMLARTDATLGKKQLGITFFLVDLTTPGITVRPIRTLSDELEFCEVFFDEVRVSAQNIVGGLNQGWTVAKALLGHERLFVGSPRYVRGAYERLTALVEAAGGPALGAAWDRYVALRLDYEDFTTLYADYADYAKQGGALGAEASLLKLLSSEIYQKITEEMLSLTAETGVVALPGEDQAEAATHFFQSRPSTIAGGTSQVQRSIIARAVLGLPG